MKAILFILSITALAISSLSAATVKVEFENPDKYSDIDYFNGSKVKFHKQLFTEFEKHINVEANKFLPENYQLNISFTDIDLAGRYDYVGNNHIRIVRDIDFPKLKFSYQLNKDGVTIVDSKAYLKDMSFLRHNQNAKRHSFNSFYHEKRLLDKWLNKTIKLLIN